jgi:hypothetical protein
MDLFDVDEDAFGLAELLDSTFHHLLVALPVAHPRARRGYRR